jgi:phage shock protein PspC (stress-responsive transcriptional regulator)
MSTPYPPPPPKRLMRSTSNRVIGGVCGGVAQYLNMDANLVRILTVLISLFTGVPVILYIIALFVMPEDTSQPTAPPPVTGMPTHPGPFSATEAAAPAPAYAPYPGAAGAPRATAEDAVWGSEGPPWEQRQPEPTPAADEPVPTAPAAQPTSTSEPVVPSEPVSPVSPIAPSEPEAPVTPPAEDQAKTDDKPPS